MLNSRNDSAAHHSKTPSQYNSIFAIGDRVSIDEGTKLGILRYLGVTKFRPGIWAGIELDEAVGKHDGEVNGISYFHCEPLHGIFVHPSKMKKVDGISNNSSNYSSHQNPPSTPIKLRQLNGLSLPPLTPPPARKHSKIIPQKLTETVHSRFGHSVTELEAELKRRYQIMMEAKQTLSALRMDVPSFMERRGLEEEDNSSLQNLLNAVDSYDKAVSKYERQLRRLQNALSDQQQTMSRSLENMENNNVEANEEFKAEKEALLNERIQLLNRIQSLNEQLEHGEIKGAQLEAKLAEIEEKHAHMQEQSHHHASLVAKLNNDRNTLRRELAELREKLSYFMSEENNHLTMLLQENNSLKAELQNASPDRQDQSADWETTINETNELLEKMKEKISTKEEEFNTLQEELNNEINLLRREKEIADEKIVALQRKVIDYQEVSQMEASYCAQIESLRNSIEENWNKFSSQLAQKDAIIEELQSSNGYPLVSYTSQEQNAQLIQAQVSLAELQTKYQELFDAKVKQEQYFTRLLSKYKRNKASTLHTIAEEDTLNQDEAAMMQLQTKVEQLKIENRKVLEEKDSIIKGLQSIIRKIQEEKTELLIKVDDLEGDRPLDSSRVENLKNEVEVIQAEREMLREALKEAQEKLRSSRVELGTLTERLVNMEEQLSRRTDEEILAKQEAKSAKRTIDMLNQKIENVSRELSSKQRLFDTEKSILLTKIKDLEERSLDSKSELINRLIREKEALSDSLRAANEELHSIRALSKPQDAEYLKQRIHVLEEDLQKSREKQMKLEVDLSVEIEDMRKEIERRDLYIQELEAGSPGEVFESDSFKKISIFSQVDEYKRRVADLEAVVSQLNETLESVKQGNLDSDNLQVLLEKERQHNEELRASLEREKLNVELAASELETLQRKICENEDLDRQRRTFVQKLQQSKDEIHRLQDKLAEKEQEIIILKQEELKISNNDRLTNEISESGDIQKLTRVNESLEYEKRLLEAELVRVRGSLKDIRKQSGDINQNRHLIEKAGILLQELAAVQESTSWSMIKPLKSIASFMKLYKPIQVDIEKLKKEYESLSSSLEKHFPNVPSEKPQISPAEFSELIAEEEGPTAPSDFILSS